jgi:superfamily II DNA or RNA helicase
MNLLPFQEDAASLLIDTMGREGVSLNASDTGTGKTYMGLHLAQAHKGPLAIICPKATIPNWQRLATENGINPIFVKNIESLKTGRHPVLGKEGKNKFTWNLPAGTLVLCDEAHNFSGQDSQNAYALAYLKTRPDVHVHLMSATLADSPAKFRAFGFLMGLHDFVHFKQWAYQHGCFQDEYGNLRFTRIARHGEGPMRKLHEEIFPRFGIRLRIADLGSAFPENTISTELVAPDVPTAYKSRVSAYMRTLTDAEVEDNADWAERSAGKSGRIADNAMVRMLRERQEIELLKLPHLAKLVEAAEEEGVSTAIFLNFKESIRWLNDMLIHLNPALVTGDMNGRDREQSRDLFQSNAVHVFLATHGAGGTGIDLHDLLGRPRQSIISPCFATVQFKQTLGRIHRAGSRSPAVQHILCMADTAEEMVLKRLGSKLQNLSLLNDGDLTPEIDI